MENRINLSPLHWGPKTWFFLESAAMGYPLSPTDDEKTSAKNLLVSLKDLLPCENCRIHYKQYIDKYTPQLDNIVKDRDTLITFINDLHNDVRKRNKQNTRSIEDVFDYYHKEYSNPPVVTTETFVNNNNKIKSKDEIIKNMQHHTKEDYSNITSDLLFHFNPITLIIGVMLGLIIYKFYLDTFCANDKS